MVNFPSSVVLQPYNAWEISRELFKGYTLLPGQTPEVSNLIGLGPGSLSATVDYDVCQILGPTMEEFSHCQGSTVIQIDGHPRTPVPELGWSSRCSRCSEDHTPACFALVKRHNKVPGLFGLVSL